MSLNQEDFEADPWLIGIGSEVLQDGLYERQDLNAELCGLPLVAGWRSFPTSLESAYRKMVERVSLSFVSTTGYGQDSGCKDEPEAHIYPFEDLHVTIATFRSFLGPVPANTNAQSIKDFCVDAVENATKMEGWPKGSGNDKVKLCLKPKEVRLSKTNAIILWEETTGNLEAMRLCLKKEMMSRQHVRRGSNDVDPVSDLSFSVPGIVHSTFIRFWKCPSNPDVLKQMIKENVLLNFLPIEVEVNANAKLVCEDTPCMHIKDDESHVLWKDV